MNNRVLTDNDRELYKPVIDTMYKYIPMIGHKIQDANVQQAFVYQTTVDLFPKKNVRILSAGSYQDTAAELLRFNGYAVYDVDPVINYDLHTYCKLLNDGGLYDAVISTSVLEHTTDDQEFIDDICALLKKNGYGILTVDFKDDWNVGEPVPYTSNRFYTTYDLTQRLNAILIDNDCELLEYDYSARDRFIWDGINYGFATFVFKKVK